MMGDAVTTVTKIVEIVMKIKKAADMVKQNEDVCKQIQSRVEILSSTLSQYQDNEELMDNWGVMRTLEALADVLGEALKLVTDCQEADTNFVCLFYNAGNLSQELIKVEQRISNKNMDAMFAIMAFLLPKPTTPSSVRPTAQERQVSPVGRQEPFELQEMQPPFPVQQMGRRKQDGGDGDVTYDKCNLQLYPDRRKAPLQYPTIQPPNPPLQMWRQKQNEDDVDVQSDNSYTRYFAGVRAEARKESYTRDIQWDSSVDALCSCCAMVKRRTPARRPSSAPIGQQRSQLSAKKQKSQLQQIAGVALDIEEAAETVLQNTEACIEIDKRVSTVSALLSKLENTDMVEEQAMKDALNKLLEIFRHAHALVMACQKSGLVTMLFCNPPCILSKQLSEVLDQLVPNINALIAVILNSCNVRARRYYQWCHLLIQVQNSQCPVVEGTRHQPKTSR
uniref:Mixed lineage kinase domain-containing protein n=1 Tax=Aegilops tauschii subsp. strangulata TaxID=200361 RepID=A0A453GQL5_AEGTS